MTTAVAAPQGTLFKNLEMRPQDFNRIREILYAESGIAVSEAKTSLIQSRLAKRLRELGMSKFSEYTDLLSGADGLDERMTLISALTTNVTNFFREPHHFEHLREAVFPSLRQRLSDGGRVRFWSAGCSTGQEPYSISMTMLPLLAEYKKADFRILASDIDPKVVAHGHEATYREDLLDGIPGPLRKKYLEAAPNEPGSLRFVRHIRELVVFKQLNLLKPWPMKGQFDVIFCRNVVIYFDQETRNRLWLRFAQQLAPGGVLFIGHSERLEASFNDYFENIGPTTYQRTNIPCRG